jgi:hypothetical protein
VIRIGDVLAVHRGHRRRGAIHDVLGDGVLCARATVYARVRERVLALGYRFQAVGQEAYFDFPLLGLDTIYRTRTIPYRRSHRAFVRLRRLGDATLADLETFKPEPNVAFHESAHCVAHESLASAPRDGELVRLMLGEAFANAVEASAAAELHQRRTLEDRLAGFFFRMNSYWTPRPMPALARLRATLGASAALRALWGGFLFSNFLYDALSTRDLEKVWEIAGGPGNTFVRNRATLSQLVRQGPLRLSPHFRVLTHDFYLRYLGYPKGVLRRVTFCPGARLLACPELLASVERLADDITNKDH